MLSHSGSRIITLAGNTIIQLFLELCQPDLIVLNSLLIFSAVLCSFSSFLRTKLSVLLIEHLALHFPVKRQRTASVCFKCLPSLAGSH